MTASSSPNAHRDLAIGALAGVAIGFGLSLLPAASDLRSAPLWLVTLLGSVFIAALKMTMAPLIFASVASGIKALWAHHDAGRIWKLTLGFFAFTASIAVAIGIVAANLFEPGRGLPPGLLGAAATAQAAPDAAEFVRHLLVDSLQNPFHALADTLVLPLIVAALLLGAAIGQAPQPLLVVGWVMRFAPLGIGALLAKLVATASLAVFGALASFALVVTATTLLHGLVVLPALVWVLAGLPPWRYLAAIRAPMLTAFATSSSAATMPVTLDCADRELRIDPRVSRFVIPLGTTVNMDGTALYEAAAALFVAQLAGVPLDLGQQIIVALMAMLAAI
ncbi:MAG: dicarboxylate/amino acid:cation symporter, partial [Betaproteobacteria bacterium]|nr:dicarboxylate/amino acid:cation symporter [Betaproteobacteria bacterium]